ncbi:TIGR02757 family protein [Thermodesulfovibrio hydrogeniphilus]
MMHLKEKLESLYSKFDFESAIQNDPIKFPKKYSHPLDIEVSAIIASSFAYGSIKCFCNFLHELFKIMGEHPADFVINFKPQFLLKKNLKYRFSNIYDISAFIFVLKNLLRESGTLQNYFKCNPLENDIQEPLLKQVKRISNFVDEALKVDLSPIYGKNIKTNGFLHFLPHPAKKSPCKRINLFLRWMVRDKDIDFGIWNSIKPDELLIPLDVHVWNVAKRLGLTKRKTPDLKSAVEITQNLKQLDSQDPLKYDFVLCHGDINSLI